MQLRQGEVDRQGLIRRYDARVPRYTSYPTAAQFTPAVDAAAYAGWLSQVDVARPISLYAHVPFCARLCWFCGCNTRVVHGRKPVTDYVGWLVKEAALIRRHLPDGVTADAVHLGGGTPNMLAPDDLAALFAMMRETFNLVPGAQIAA